VQLTPNFITVTSAISLLMGTSLGAIAGGDTSRFGALAACTAILVAALGFAAWFVRAGSLVSFVSETVLIGFKVGVALTLASTQLPKLLGISGAHGEFWKCVHHLFTHLNETKPASLTIGLAALAVLLFGKFFLKNKPVALVVVIGGIVAAGYFDLESRGVKMLGDVPRGIPIPGLPAVHLSDLNDLLPLAMACLMLAAVEPRPSAACSPRKTGGASTPTRSFSRWPAPILPRALGMAFRSAAACPSLS
jgi:MFS superfamily sulfate permease-like transporter